VGTAQTENTADPEARPTAGQSELCRKKGVPQPELGNEEKKLKTGGAGVPARHWPRHLAGAAQAGKPVPSGEIPSPWRGEGQGGGGKAF
jgi:hypothetical protein